MSHAAAAVVPPPAVPMEYRNMGRTGLKVSALGFGTWISMSYQLDLPAAKEIIQTAYDAGVNFYDTAEVYAAGEAEVLLGQAIKELALPRRDLVICTKLFFGADGGGGPAGEALRPTAKGLSRKHVVEGTRASLARLQLEYVDVLLCHRPDPATPIEETVRAMNWVVDQGLAFYWGTSEWGVEQVQEAWRVSEQLGLIGPAVEQPEYNLFHRRRVEEEYAPLYREHGLGLTTWSPLASGVLTGKYGALLEEDGEVPAGSRFLLERYQHLRERKLVGGRGQLAAVEARLRPLAQRLGCSLAQLALAWCVANPHVSSVLTGASSAAQLRENLGALAVVPLLTEEVMAEVDAAVAGLGE